MSLEALGIINGNGITITSKTLVNGIELNISNITAGNSVSIWIEALANDVCKLTNNVTVYCKENDNKLNAYAAVEVVIPKDSLPQILKMIFKLSLLILAIINLPAILFLHC